MFQPQEFVFQTQEFSLWNMAFHAKLGEIKKQERERGRLRILKIKKSSYSSKKKVYPAGDKIKVAKWYLLKISTDPSEVTVSCSAGL